MHGYCNPYRLRSLTVTAIARIYAANAWYIYLALVTARLKGAQERCLLLLLVAGIMSYTSHVLSTTPTLKLIYLLSLTSNAAKKRTAGSALHNSRTGKRI